MQQLCAASHTLGVHHCACRALRSGVFQGSVRSTLRCGCLHGKAHDLYSRCRRLASTLLCAAARRLVRSSAQSGTQQQPTEPTVQHVRQGGMQQPAGWCAAVRQSGMQQPAEWYALGWLSHRMLGSCVVLCSLAQCPHPPQSSMPAAASAADVRPAPAAQTTSRPHQC
jgi:hypothetical protein